MKNNFLILLVITITTLSCSSIAWRHYKKPKEEADFVNSTCIKIGKQNLNERQTKAIQEAANDVCNIMHSEEFKQKVISKTWLASCDHENGMPDKMDGQKVYDLLMQQIPNYSINAQKPWHAIAQTQRMDSIYSRVAIMPSRIEAWYSTNNSIKSELVNTLAHETTHVISDNFLDAGHGTNKCEDSSLVSYGIGNLVEEIWLEQHNY